jgi:hypothetical protein
MMQKSDDQMLTKSSRASRFARSDIRYWENAVFQRVRDRKGKKDRSKHFSVQLQRAGRRAEFSLRTANKAVAARKAREIYEHLKATGWTATLAKFKAGPEPRNNGAIETVGEFLAAIEETTSSRGRTLSEYIRSFRRIVAGAFDIDDPKKYDYRGGGRRVWIDRIDSIQLEKVTPQVVQSWKVDFLSRAGQNPAKQRTARISVIRPYAQHETCSARYASNSLHCPLDSPPLSSMSPWNRVKRCGIAALSILRSL